MEDVSFGEPKLETARVMARNIIYAGKSTEISEFQLVLILFPFTREYGRKSICLDNPKFHRSSLAVP